MSVPSLVAKRWFSDLTEAKEERLNELAERYEPALRENTTQEWPVYRGAEEAKAAVMPYIRGALCIGTEEDDEVAWYGPDKKKSARIFTTVGQMGSGKTRLQYELCRQEAVKTGFGSTHVNFVRLLLFGESFYAFAGVSTTIFGRNLLMCTGMDRADAERVQSLEEAVELLYRRLTWPSGKAQALVVCVDEFLRLPTGGGTTPADLANLLRELMLFQERTCKGEQANRVVFLFLANTEARMAEVAGMQLCVRNVPTLGKDDALDLLFELRPDLRARYKDDGEFEQLVHLCLARPRLLLIGIPNAYPEGVESVDMASALNEVADSNGLVNATNFFLKEEDVQSWLTSMSLCGSSEYRELQKRRGVTAAGGGLDPVALRFWCEVWSNVKWENFIKCEKTLPLACHLREAYVADTKVQASHEKDAKEVLYNFEAAKRASYKKGEKFYLSEYYTGGTIKGGLEEACVCAFEPWSFPNDNLVETVTTFKKTTDVVGHLKKACVVLSTSAGKWIEYLVPFFDPESGALTYVAAVQVKFSPNKPISGGHKKICDAVMKHPIVKHLEESNVTCFPVVFSTSHGDMSKSAGKVGCGVLYDEAAMVEFTKCLGPLRLHRKKASAEQIDVCSMPHGNERNQSEADTEAPKAKKARTG